MLCVHKLGHYISSDCGSGERANIPRDLNCSRHFSAPHGIGPESLSLSIASRNLERGADADKTRLTDDMHHPSYITPHS